MRNEEFHSPKAELSVIETLCRDPERSVQAKHHKNEDKTVLDEDRRKQQRTQPNQRQTQALGVNQPKNGLKTT